MLDDHTVLTTDQLTRAFFTRPRTCLLRLEALRGLGLLHRFRFAQPRGGTEPWKWVLDLVGAQVQAAATGRRMPTQRAHEQHLYRLTFNPALDHLLATNEFFVRLLHAARIPAASPAGGAPRASEQQRLDRWWPEQVATARFPGIRPDGHGLWTSHVRTIGLFLETDLGSENLARLLSKLDGYERLARSGGPVYPVLFWLHSPERETNLQKLLRAAEPEVPVATAVHTDDPAGAVWLPADGWHRVRLHELPSDHGIDHAANPNWRDGHLDLGDQPHTRRAPAH